MSEVEKLILENQLAIMQALKESHIYSNYTESDLNKSIQKTYDKLRK